MFSVKVFADLTYPFWWKPPPLIVKLREQPWVHSIKAIPGATVPVIKVKAAPVPLAINKGATGGIIWLDITFDRPGHQGVAVAKYVSKLLCRNDSDETTLVLTLSTRCLHVGVTVSDLSKLCLKRCLKRCL